MKRQRQFLTGWMLVALFLGAQLYISAHDAAHDSKLADSSCQICLSASALNGANLPAIQTFAPVSPAGFVIRQPASQPLTTALLLANPRAPPLFS